MANAKPVAVNNQIDQFKIKKCVKERGREKKNERKNPK